MARCIIALVAPSHLLLAEFPTRENSRPAAAAANQPAATAGEESPGSGGSPGFSIVVRYTYTHAFASIEASPPSGLNNLLKH